MKPITKRIFIFSAVTVISGLTLMGVGMGLGGRPGVLFSKDGIRSPYQEKKPYIQEKSQLEEFHSLNLSIDSDAQIRILPSNDQNYYIEYLLDGNNQKPRCEVTDDTLHFSQTDSQNYMVGMFGIQLGSFVQSEPFVTLYLPEDVLLKQTQIFTSYGDISLSSVNLGKASVETEYGNISLKDTTAETLHLQLESGDCFIDELTTDTLNIYSEYGDIQTKKLSFQSADITLEYGDLNLMLPDSIKNYQCKFHLEYGELTLPEDAPKEWYQNEDEEVIYQTKQNDTHKNKQITVQSEDGDVQIQYP